MKGHLTLGLWAAVFSIAATVSPSAQAGNAAVEKTLIANERAVVDAVMRGDVAGFSKHVAADSWSIDPMGRSSTAEFVKMFDQFKAEMKVSKWDISDFKTIWVNPDTAVLTYKWTGEGTFMGQPVTPAWASTVWARRNGEWKATFHQETTPVAPPPAANHR